MSVWRAVKARALFRALQHIGWKIKRPPPHCILERPGYQDYTFAFHDREEIGPRMLARVAKHTGLKPEDL